VAGYALKSYSVPGITESLVTTNSTTVNGSWNPLGQAIVIPSGTWFCIPVFSTTSLDHVCPGAGWWDHKCGVTFGDDAGFSRLSFTLGGLYNHNTAGYGSDMNFPIAATWGGASLTQVRAWTTGTPFWGPAPATVNISFAGGELRVYTYRTTLPPLDVEASKTAQDDAVVSLTLSKPATRMRYRIVQASDGEMNWSGTPVGTKLRRYT